MAEILALDQDGNRLIPLVSGACSSHSARQLLGQRKASELFPRAFAPQEALGGLCLYFSCFDECHHIVQDLTSREASFWHAILHRQEPDDGNSAYWFRRVGAHPVFDGLSAAANEIAAQYPNSGFRLSPKWDPFSFIDFCGHARQKAGSAAERVALTIQSAEWQLLFDYCARSSS